MTSSDDRPHTISVAYERSHLHNRPALSADTFTRPDGSSSSSGGGGAGYAVPVIQENQVLGAPPPLVPKSREVRPPVVPDFTLPGSDQGRWFTVLTYIAVMEIHSNSIS